jgi:hypothetical protein
VAITASNTQDIMNHLLGFKLPKLKLTSLRREDARLEVILTFGKMNASTTTLSAITISQRRALKLIPSLSDTDMILNFI